MLKKILRPLAVVFLVFCNVCIYFVAEHYSFFQIDHPSNPYYWKDRPTVYNRRKPLRGYYLADCSLFRDSQFVGQFEGDQCAFNKDGNLIMMSHDGLFMRDENQNLLWRVKGSFHHIIDVHDQREEIAALATVPNDRFKTLHEVHVYDFSGHLKYKWNPGDNLDEILQHFDESIESLYATYAKRNRLDEIGQLSTAFMKINSAQIISKNKGYPKFSFLKPGNLLINIQYLSLMLIVDPELDQVVWAFRESEHPFVVGHQPTILESGNLIYFKNKSGEFKKRNFWEKIHYYFGFWPRAYFEKSGLRLKFSDDPREMKTNFSEIREITVDDKKVVWSYQSPYLFYAPTGGGMAFDEDGSIVVGHNSHGGSFFSVTRDKKILWEFFHPYNLMNSNVAQGCRQFRRVNYSVGMRYEKNFFSF